MSIFSEDFSKVSRVTRKKGPFKEHIPSTIMDLNMNQTYSADTENRIHLTSAVFP